MAKSKLVMNIKLKWYGKPVAFLCVLLGIDIPRWVFSFKVSASEL